MMDLRLSGTAHRQNNPLVAHLRRLPGVLSRVW